MTGSVLFVSPHLDDVAFSCGGTLIRLALEQFQVTLCTIFTASVAEPTGFALACQLDKGLAASVDYMALRRAEDLRFVEFAKIARCLHLPFKEAPHRGYRSADDLFQGVHPDDSVWMEISKNIRDISESFDCIFAPQGLGNHVDHLQTIRAVQQSTRMERVLWYCDTPYAIRNPEGTPSTLLPNDLRKTLLPIDVSSKSEACALYETQVPFQFGSHLLMKQKLREFHSTQSGYMESFLCKKEANSSPFQFLTMTRGI